MTYSVKAIKSTAVIPYDPKPASASHGSYLEKITDDAYRRSLKSAKYEADCFPQITSNFTGRDLVCISSIQLTPPKGHKLDSALSIEVFSSAHKERNPPILIFSHGYGTHPIKYRPFLGELASHGFTVLSVSHTSCLEEAHHLTPEEESMRMEKLSVVMANNIQYVLNEVRHGSLRGIGDCNKILLVGHSLGGAASIMAARGDSSVAGCVNLDGFLQGREKTEGLKQPLLLIIGDYRSDIEELERDSEKEARDYAKHMKRSLKEYETLHRDTPQSRKIMIERAVHTDFTDAPFCDYLAGEKTFDSAMRVHTIVADEIFKFIHFVDKTEASK